MPGEVPVAGVEIIVDGTKLDDKHVSALLDVTVRDDLQRPDTAVVRLQDPDGELIDSHPLHVGKDIAIKMGAREDRVTTTVFTGVVMAIEPEFSASGCIIAVRAYDRSYKLNGSRKSRTFQNQKAEDMVRQIIGGAGLTPGTIDSTGVVHEYFQQSMESDWAFCRRLAVMSDFELVVEDRTVHFRKRTRGAVAATLRWGEALIDFRPRQSAAGQATDVTVANHDPKQKRKLVGRATTPALAASSPAANGRRRAASELGGGPVVVADRVVTNQAEADKVAQATLDRLASSYVEAEGKAFGLPTLRAGATVDIQGVGTAFGGRYVLSQTTHRFGRGADYTTAFVISGRTGHAITDLVRQGAHADWASSLVVGVVTNANDPEKLGRVRVKFPALGDDIEGWWARVATLNAGPQRGMYMLPQVNDDVVVAFEHGDPRRPVILGSLYNGKDKPPAEVLDGKDHKAKFGVKSDHEVHLEGKQAMTVRTGEKLTVEVQTHGQGGTGDYLLDAKGNVEQKAVKNIKATASQSIELTANQSVTIKGTGSVTVEATGSLKLKGATVDIQANGPVNVKGMPINLG